MRVLFLLPLLVLPAPARAERRFTAAQLEARDYKDLGPSDIDTASYPEEQRGNYLILVKACSSCHTLARVVNSPLITREDWTRSVKRMHQRAKSSAGKPIDKNDAKASIEFLTYDANIRKVKDAARFKAKTAELEALFEEVRRERDRIRLEGK